MNIFVLDSDPFLAARYHCDKHVVKMILETAQLLSTAHHLKGDPHTPELYLPSHENHPCSLWARESASNYQWLQHLGICLCDEYEGRYGREHKSNYLLTYVLDAVPANITYYEQTPHPQCMPDEYKVYQNPVQAYRNYYQGAKSRFAKWAHSSTPPWWIPESKDAQKGLDN